MQEDSKYLLYWSLIMQKHGSNKTLIIGTVWFEVNYWKGLCSINCVGCMTVAQLKRKIFFYSLLTATAQRKQFQNTSKNSA